MKGEATPAFACAGEGCERLAWLPDGAGVTVNGEVQGRELEGSALWYEVLLDCPCFDFRQGFLENPPSGKISPALWQPVWSPSGARIAAVAGTEFYVWNAAGKALLTYGSSAPASLRQLAWSPDGTQMALTGYDPDRQTSLLWLLDASGRSQQFLGSHSKWLPGVAWSPDGRRLAVIGDELRLGDFQKKSGLLVTESFTSTMDWSPGGNQIVTGSQENDVVRVWDATDGQLLHNLGGEGDSQTNWVDWSPDGARFAAFDFLKGMIRVWDAASGQLVGKLAEGDTGFIFSVAWSPDGKHLVYALNDDRSGRLKRWDGTEQNPPQTLYNPGQGILHLSFSPGGQFLVVEMVDNVRILDAENGRTIASLSLTETRGYSGKVDWSPDGRRILLFGVTRDDGSDNIYTDVLVWDLTLIPAGPLRAFVHSSHLAGG